MNEHLEFLRRASQQTKIAPDATNPYVAKGQPQPHQPTTSFDTPQSFAGETPGWMPELHNNDEVACFGGWMFRSMDKNHQPVIRFVTDRMDAEQVRTADEWYNRLGRMRSGKFLHLTNGSPFCSGKYVIFDFEIGDQMFSLGELHRQGNMPYQKPEKILEKLNDLIIEYRAETAGGSMTYKALNCLTMDTVFVDMDNHIKVLPVYSCGSKYPVEIAREVLSDGQKTDERSDLYAAAYVAVQAFSDSIGDKEIRKPESQVILDCLQPIRDWRPTPDEVRQLLRGNHPVPVTKVGGVPKDRQIDPELWDKFRTRLRDLRKKLRLPEEMEEDIHLEDTQQPDLFPVRRNTGNGKRNVASDDSWV